MSIKDFQQRMEEIQSTKDRLEGVDKIAGWEDARNTAKSIWNYLPNKAKGFANSLMHQKDNPLLPKNIGTGTHFTGNNPQATGAVLADIQKQLTTDSSNGLSGLIDVLKQYDPEFSGKTFWGNDMNLDQLAKAPVAMRYANDMIQNHMNANVAHRATQALQGGALLGGAMSLPNIIHRMKGINEVKKSRPEEEEKEASEKKATPSFSNTIFNAGFGQSAKATASGQESDLMWNSWQLPAILALAAGGYFGTQKLTNKTLNTYSDRFMDKEEQTRRQQLVDKMTSNYKSAQEKLAKNNYVGDPWLLTALALAWTGLGIPAYQIGKGIGKDTSDVDKYDQFRNALDQVEGEEDPRLLFTPTNANNPGALKVSPYKTLSTRSVPFPTGEKKKDNVEDYTDPALKLASDKQALFGGLFDPVKHTVFNKNNDNWKTFKYINDNQSMINRYHSSAFAPEWAKGIQQMPTVKFDTSDWLDPKSAYRSWNEQVNKNPQRKREFADTLRWYTNNQGMIREHALPWYQSVRSNTGGIDPRKAMASVGITGWRANIIDFLRKMGLVNFG